MKKCFILFFFTIICYTGCRIIINAEIDKNTSSILDGVTLNDITQVNVIVLPENREYQFNTSEEVQAFYEAFSKVKFDKKIKSEENNLNGEVIKIELYLLQEDDVCFYLSDNYCADDNGMQYIGIDSIECFYEYLDNIKQKER